MTDNRDNARRQLARLADALARDIDQLTDEELAKEAAQEFGSVDKAAAVIKSRITRALEEGGRRRLAAARQAYDSHLHRNQSKIARLSLERKRVIIERFASNDNALQQKLTLAARNEEAPEADIDSFLEDLVELGLIDDEGNIK